MVRHRALKGDGGYPGSAKLARIKADQISAIVDPESGQVSEDDKAREPRLWMQVRVD